MSEDTTEKPNETPPTNEPDHAQVAPEPEPDETPKVFLPRLVADEYGMTEQNALNTVLEASGIKIGDEDYDGDRRWVEYDLIVGKEIIIAGPLRSVKFTYAG